jgi:hypothetical protein
MLSVQSTAHAVGPGIARYETRYEDLTQAGHVKLTALPPAIGRACFNQLWPKHPLSVITRDGVMPILSRLVLECEPIAAKILGAFEGRGYLSFAHERDDQDRVSAILLNAHADIYAHARRRSSDEPDRQIRIGRAFGEHVFTRPFAPRDQRKVLALDVPNYPALPPTRYTRQKLGQTLQVHARARAIEPAFQMDEVPWVFGLTHTDGNQHVNSLVYVRLFEDAALRRLASVGRDPSVLAHRVEVSYRKPCFAGEQLYCTMQSFATPKGDMVVGYLSERGEPAARARCAIRMQFGSGTNDAAS